jgi:hypothetical protein
MPCVSCNSLGYSHLLKLIWFIDVIEVRRRAGDQMPAATWVISRRYSEFHDLNKRLRGKFPQVRNLEFPRRQMMLKLQKDFLHKRRIGLEKYLRVSDYQRFSLLAMRLTKPVIGVVTDTCCMPQP